MPKKTYEVPYYNGKRWIKKRLKAETRYEAMDIVKKRYKVKALAEPYVKIIR